MADWYSTIPASGARRRRFGRRELLRFGGSGLMGLSLSRLLAAEHASARHASSARADSLIVILLNGSPSHLDM